MPNTGLGLLRSTSAPYMIFRTDCEQCHKSEHPIEFLVIDPWCLSLFSLVGTIISLPYLVAIWVTLLILVIPVYFGMRSVNEVLLTLKRDLRNAV